MNAPASDAIACSRSNASASGHWPSARCTRSTRSIGSPCATISPGDIAQPLHTTKHHHGWKGENPNGYTTEYSIHAYIDGGVLKLHRINADLTEFNLRVLDATGAGRASSVIEAIDWAVAHRAYYEIRVLNLSIGHTPMESYRTDPLARAVEHVVHLAGLDALEGLEVDDDDRRDQHDESADPTRDRDQFRGQTAGRHRT